MLSDDLGGTMGVGWDAQEERDIYIHIVDLPHCTAETYATIESNCSPTKKLILKEKEKYSRAIPVAYKALHYGAPGSLSSSPMVLLAISLPHQVCFISGPLYMLPPLPGILFLQRVAVLVPHSTWVSVPSQ